MTRTILICDGCHATYPLGGHAMITGLRDDSFITHFCNNDCREMFRQSQVNELEINQLQVRPSTCDRDHLSIPEAPTMHITLPPLPPPLLAVAAQTGAFLAMKSFDDCERVMAGMSPVECPLVHRFTPGLYIREIHMPAGSLIASRIHMTEHPYVITKGRASVVRENGTVEELEAPYHGITKPGTRRLLLIHEDTVWTTFHPTHLINVEEIERTILMDYPHPGREPQLKEAA